MRPLSRAELRAALVKRLPDDHKGVFGHALVVAGSRGMAGAAILCAKAALRSGAGLVTAAVPAGIQALVAAAAPEALTLGLAENAAGALVPAASAVLAKAQRARAFTVLAVGPGLSTHPETERFLVHLLSALPLPAVVDADALNLLSRHEPGSVRQLLAARRAPCVMTPHPGEMARCLGISVAQVQKDRAACAEGLRRDWGASAVILKGRRSVIAGAGRAVLNPTGGPGLAKGGTGDVLTGLVAGLWAQMLASGRIQGDIPFLAAALGAWLHGKAGDVAQKLHGERAMTAGDLLEQFPAAFKAL